MLDLSGAELREAADCNENRDEPSGFIKRGEFLAWLSKWQLLKEETVRWSSTPVQRVVRSNCTIYHTLQSGSEVTLILRGSGFNYQPGDWCPELLVSWSFSVSPGVCQDRTRNKTINRFLSHLFRSIPYNTFTAIVDLSRSNFSIARAPLFQLKSAT